MLEFLLALLTTATVGVLLVPLLRSRFRATDRLDHDLAIYRDQLGEVERERTAGTMNEAEAAAARTEIERRVLVAAERNVGAVKPEVAPQWHKYLVPTLSLAVPLFALGLYLQVGRPGLPSQPFEAGAVRHPTVDPQQRAIQAIAELRARLTRTPDDAEALSMLGEALTLEAQGTVTKPARDALERAEKLDPADPRTQYYLGLAELQSGDARAALTRWLTLEARSPADAFWLPMLRAEIQRVSRQAGIDPKTIRLPAGGQAPPGQAPPSGMPQPTREQQEAMSRLTPEQRQAAIRSMVEGLAERLKANPNDRAGWLRLANAWRVLGENAPAAEAFAKADAIGPLDSQQLTDWAEVLVRQVAPGAAPPQETVAVLERLEKAEPRNALALFYLGAASHAAGDKPAAVRRWKALLSMLPADAPIRAQLEERVKEAEGR